MFTIKSLIATQVAIISVYLIKKGYDKYIGKNKSEPIKEGSIPETENDNHLDEEEFQNA